MVPAVPYTCVSVGKFNEWLQDKLARKYNPSLEGLNKRFYALLILLEAVIVDALELRKAVTPTQTEAEQTEEHSAAQHLLDNIIHLSAGVIHDHPKVLDAEYCETFLKTIHEKVDQLRANFHPLSHMLFTSDAWNRKADNVSNSMAQAFDSIQNLLFEIQRRTELAFPLLKEISVPLQALKHPAKTLCDQIAVLKGSRTRSEFEIAYKRLQQVPNPTQTSPFFMQLAREVKEVADVQANLNALLEPAVHISHLIKKRDRKVREEDAEENSHLSKFVNLLVKPDFIVTYLPILINIEDLVNAVHHLESRICSDLSQRHALALGLENFTPVNGEELKSACETLKKLLKQMEETRQSPELQEELRPLQGNWSLEQKKTQFL